LADNPFAMFGYTRKLFSLGSSNRASSFASTAIETKVGIDNILAISFRNRFNRTCLSTSAATEALININLICHLNTPPIIFPHYITDNSKNQWFFKELIKFSNFFSIFGVFKAFLYFKISVPFYYHRFDEDYF